MARGHADVVVVAAGASHRFGSDKLDADLGGRPLLAWTIDRVAASPLVDRIVVVTAADRVDRIQSAGWLSPKVVRVIAGGARRQDSVRAGIEAVVGLAVGEGAEGAAAGDGDDRVMLVHDGARPLVSLELIEAVIRAVEEHGAALPMLPIAETIKRVGADGRILETVDRTGLSAAQTPQGATLGAFRRALASAAAGAPREFTDEAALLEACTIPVHAIPGDPANLKVTLPADLTRIDAILAAGIAGRPGPVNGGQGRVGIGSDRHPFGPGSGLMLGGVAIERAPRLHGHSDGDVVLHALADALLGAAGLGDLGRIFPAGPETPRGIASTELLAEVVARVTAAGFAVAGVDGTIVAARPRLAAVLPAIGERIAALLGIAPGLVNMKASTGNLSGMDGTGRGISAEVAVVLVVRGAGT